MLLFTTAAFSTQKKALYFVAGFTVNEYSFFNKQEKYGDELRKRIEIFKNSEDLKPIHDALDSILEIDLDKDETENFMKIKSIGLHLSEKLQGRDKFDFVLGTIVSEIVALKNIKQPLTDCIDIFKIISEKFKDTDPDISVVLNDVITMHKDNTLTGKNLIDNLKKIFVIYKDKQKLQDI